MQGSLISSGTNTTATTGSGGYDPFVGVCSRKNQPSNSPVTADPQWDPFKSASDNQNQPTGTASLDEQITNARKDNALRKILSNNNLISLYERKLAGEDVEKDLKMAREDLNLRNDDINKYIEYKKLILQSLSNIDSNPQGAIAALQKIKNLPDSMKNNLLAKVKEDLNNSSAVSGSVYNADQILDGDFESILTNNPKIAAAVIKSVKNLSTNESFTLPLEQKKEINDGAKTATKTVAWGLAGSGVGAALGATALSNFWNPVGWAAVGALAIGGIAYLANSESAREGISTVWKAATDYS